MTELYRKMIDLWIEQKMKEKKANRMEFKDIFRYNPYKCSIRWVEKEIIFDTSYLKS